MKKTLLAIAITAMSLTAYAQNSDQPQEEYIQTEELKALEMPLTSIGQAVFNDCLQSSAKGAEYIKGVTVEELSANCSSIAMVLDELEDSRQLILKSITEKDFDTSLFISANGDLFMFKLELLASFFIESPNEKRDIVKFLKQLEGQHNLTPEEIKFNLDKLDIKYKSFMINQTLYKNLKDSYTLLKADMPRIFSLKEENYQKKLALYNKILQNNPDKADEINAIIDALKEEYELFLKGADFHIKNMDKYLVSKSKVNEVFAVFNRKNPLYLPKLPYYTKSECQILKDWKLDVLAKESWQVKKIPGCK